MQLVLKERLKASGIHLAISAVIFAVALYLIACVWYPDPLFSIAGGWQGVRIMLFVDMVLGPLLTLMVFDPSKGWSRLRFDLMCIAMAQGAALAWGFMAVHDQRPLAMVHWKGEFNVVIAEDYDQQRVTPDALDRFGDLRPARLTAVPPRSQEEAAGATAYQMMEGLMPWHLDFLHEPLIAHWEEIKQKSRQVAGHLQQHPQTEAALATIEKKSGLGRDQLIYFPVNARYGEALLVFNPEGEILGALEGTSYDDPFLGFM